MSHLPPYDLAVIGSGPAGQRGAIAAAKLGKRVIVIDRMHALGGVCVHTGTIPSKTLREAVLHLTGFRERSFYGQSYTLKEQVSVTDLAHRVDVVIAREVDVIRSQLRRNAVTLMGGHARFKDPHTLEVETDDGPVSVSADHILIACGTRCATTPTIPVDGVHIISADQLGQLTAIPREAIVVGGGVIGLEYASMLSALGAEVTVIDQRPTLLDFVDREIIDALCYHLRERGSLFRLGEKVTSVAIDSHARVTAHLESGKKVHGELLLYAVGRETCADALDLAAIGLQADERGRIAVNEHFQTTLPHVYAAGDVIGFPALAATAVEQGRLAARHMFGVPTRPASNVPYGIYTIPEISMVGRNEQQLTADKVPYEVGIARYAELAKAQMIGDETGMLKILFDPESLAVLGVHVIGDRAAEIVHIGQAVMALGGTIEYFRDAVFNYPTMAEAYKVAAHDGLNKLANLEETGTATPAPS